MISMIAKVLALSQSIHLLLTRSLRHRSLQAMAYQAQSLAVNATHSILVAQLFKTVRQYLHSTLEAAPSFGAVTVTSAFTDIRTLVGKQQSTISS